MQRACEAVLDKGQHLVSRKRLGVPHGARDVSELLARGHWIDADWAAALKRMVTFMNIAVYDYQSLLVLIMENFIPQPLDEFLAYTKIVLKRTA